MKTALLAQNEALEAKQLNPDVKKSMIPLSHTVQYPVDVDGAILPCCCIEVVPSDSYRISNEILLRQLQPLKVPQMTKYTLNTAYFYCSNRLGYKKWEQFFDQAHKGRANINYSFELPTVATNSFSSFGNELPLLIDKNTRVNDYGEDYNNTLHTYFNISHGITVSGNAGETPTVKCHGDEITADQYNPNDLPLAFPFFDYQMICRDFYTNIDRIADLPDTDNFYNYNDPISDWAFSNIFPIDDDEIKLKDGIQIKSGYNTDDDADSSSIKGFVLDKVRYHDVRPDYFTSSKRAPMRGEAPTVDTTVAVAGIDATRVMGTDTTATIFANMGVDSDNKIASYVDAGTLTVHKDGDTGFVDDVSYSREYTNVNDSTTNAKIKSALEKLDVKLETAKSINAAELILMTQLTLWQTLNMLAKPTYNDFLKAHFDGVHVGDSLAEKPMYIGGTSTVIDVNEVLQTSQSTDSSKLGTQGAVAHALSSSYVGSFFANDQGFIIGIMYILPDLLYKPAMPRWASRRTVEDFFFPEFANLSMQATLNKELFFSNDDEWNNQPLGYVGAYDELRSIPNYVAGQMLDDDMTDLKRWVILREFENDNKPAINQRFLNMKGNINKEAWTAPNLPKFMFQIANYVEAMRPMPWLAIPQIGN